MTPAAKTCPASLVSESSSQRSSSTPSRQMIAPAISTAVVSEPLRYVRCSVGIRLATSRATAMPPKIATPPRRGVGIACTSRSRGRATAPHRRASTRTTGVSRNVTAAAMQKTSAYSRTGNSAPRVRGVRLDQRPNPRGDLLGRARLANRPADERGDILEVALGHSLRSDRRGSDADAGGHHRRLRVVRDRVLVQRDPGGVATRLRLLAGRPDLAEVDQRE